MALTSNNLPSSALHHLFATAPASMLQQFGFRLVFHLLLDGFLNMLLKIKYIHPCKVESAIE